MADQPVTREKLINADKDVQVIEDFIKKPKDETVTTRFGDEIMTLKGLEEEVKKSGGYFKRYTSLAAANADLANIPVDAVVKVTSAVDGGDYERVYEEATTLTKSDYDPVNLAVNIATNKSNKHTDLAVSLLKIKTDNIYQPVLQDLTTLLSVANFVSTSQTVTTSSNCAITSITASAANDKVGTLSISSGLGFEIKEWLFGGDAITGAEKSSNWVDYHPKSSDIVSHTLNTDADGDYRVNITLSNYPGVIDSSTHINVFDKSLTLKSVSQLELAALSVPAISTHSGSSIQLKIPKYFLTENGYDASVIQNAFSLVESFIDNLQLKVKTSVRKTATNSLLYALLPKDTYTVTITDLDASFYLSEVLSKQSIKTLPAGASKVYTTSVVNSLNEVRTNAPIALKVTFERGDITSDRQMIVTDENGTQYSAQFAPEYCVNFKDDVSEGYHSDGSFKTGTVYILGNLEANQTKQFKIHVYQDNVQTAFNAVVTADPSSNNFDLINCFDGEFKISYSKTSFSSKLLNTIETAGGAKFDLTEDMRLSVALAATPSTLVTPIITGTRKQAITRSGNVFVDLEVELLNAAVQGISENSLKIYKVYRMFKNGLLKIFTYVIALKDLPMRTMYGFQQVIQNASQITNFSNPHAAALYTIGDEKAVMCLNSCYGDIHRDGVDFGPTRPPVGNMVNSGTEHTFRFGWSDSVGSASSEKWNIEKGHSWFTEVDFFINPNTTDFTTLLDHLNNEPTGFVIEGMQGANQISRALMHKIADYCISVKDYIHEFIHPVYSNQYRLFTTMLMQDKIENTDNFTTIYNAWRDSMIVNWGVDYVDNYTTAYTTALSNPSGKYFRMQYESRLSLPAIQWLYFEAVKRNDTVKRDQLKSIIANIAPVMRDFALANTGIGISPAVAPTSANPNSTASGMRYLALAIYMGLDTDGSMRTAFDKCEGHLIDPEGWMRNKNHMLDYHQGRTANGRYLHYALYTESMYKQACLLLGKAPNHDVSQLALQAFTSDGVAKDIEFCISESRRGIRNTSSFAINCLMTEKSSGRLVAASKVMDRLVNHYGWTEDYKPSRVEGFYYSLDPSKNETTIGSDMSFTVNTLSDVWLARYYGLSV